MLCTQKSRMCPGLKVETVPLFLRFFKSINLNIFYICCLNAIALNSFDSVFGNTNARFSCQLMSFFSSLAGTCNDYLFPSGPCHSKSSPEHFEKRLTEIINHSQKCRRWHTLSRYSSLLLMAMKFTLFLSAS